MESNKLYVTREEFNKLEERVRVVEISKEVNVHQYNDIKETLKVIQDDIEQIKSIPNKRQEDVISKLITTVVGAVVGAILALIMK